MALGSLSSWLAPPKYVRAAVLMSCGGLLFGLDTGTIGPITTMPQFTTTFGHLSSTMHGLVVSTILIPAALSSLFCGHLSNRLGRLRATSIGALIFALGAALECASSRLAMLFVGRATKGIGQGLFLSTVVVYITEIAPPRCRGILASVPQLVITIGIVAGYFTCYGTVNIASSLAWRFPYALQCFCALTFALAVLTLPQSPRWLSYRGRHDDARAVWQRLQVPLEEREKAEVETGEAPKRLGARELFAVFGPRAWKRTVLAMFLMGMQQMSGIDGVLYYAPLLFQSAGLTSSTSSFLASGVSALLIFLTTVPATLLADKIGRKTSTVWGGVAQAVCMCVIGSLYASDSVHERVGGGRWAVVAMIFLFTIAFSATWGVVFRVYVSEIQMKETRAGATSLSLSVNWIVNWIVAFTTPIFLARSSSGVYFLWGGSITLTVIVSLLFMPETRGMSLEDIEDSFRKEGFHDPVVREVGEREERVL